MVTNTSSALHRPARASRLPATQRRDQILDTAIDLFAKNGYTGTATADIAAAAGIGEPTIYRYFAGKHDLYMAALQRTDDEVRSNWERIAEENPDPLNALLLLGTWYHRTLGQRPEILQLRAKAMTEPPDEAVAEAVRHTYLEFRSFIEGLFQRAKQEGRLSKDSDVRTLTWLFMAIGALLDLGHQMGLEDELTPADLVAMAGAVLERRFT